MKKNNKRKNKTKRNKTKITLSCSNDYVYAFLSVCSLPRSARRIEQANIFCFIAAAVTLSYCPSLGFINYSSFHSCVIQSSGCFDEVGLGSIDSCLGRAPWVLVVTI